MQNSFFIKNYVKADAIIWFDNITFCQINHLIFNTNILAATECLSISMFLINFGAKSSH